MVTRTGVTLEIWYGGRLCQNFLERPLLVGAGSPSPPCSASPRVAPRYDLKVLGYNLMQAMRFAVEEVNNRSSLLPGVQLGYELVDTCYLSNNVQPVLYFLAQEDYFLPILDDYSDYVPRVVAVIGPDNSESTTTVANFLSLFLLPQVRLPDPGGWAGAGDRKVVTPECQESLPPSPGNGGRNRVGWSLSPSLGEAAQPLEADGPGLHRGGVSCCGAWADSEPFRACARGVRLERQACLQRQCCTRKFPAHSGWRMTSGCLVELRSERPGGAPRSVKVPAQGLPRGGSAEKCHWHDLCSNCHHHHD